VRARVNVLEDKDEVFEAEPPRPTHVPTIHVHAEVVHDLLQLLVGFDLCEGHVDDRPTRVLCEGFDHARLASARWAVEQEAELVWKATHTVLALLTHKVMQQPQQRRLLREEEVVECLRLCELVALVPKIRQLIIGPAALGRYVGDHCVQPPPVIFDAHRLSPVPIESSRDEGVDTRSAVGLLARQLEDGQLIGLVTLLL